MEQKSTPAQAASIRSAASIVMVRDGPTGLEVFLVKRHGLSDVHGGVFVFPGGKVDTHDAAPEIHERLDMSATELHGALNEPDLSESAAAALHIAAIREAFEETTVLYAQGADEARAAVAWELMREGRGFEEVAQMMGLRLQARRLQPWSRWITPPISSVGAVQRKRFDTRFFLATIPQGQLPRHDGHEAVDSVWLAPRQALQQYWDRQIEIAPPQMMSLINLSHHDSVESALAEAKARRPPLVRPEPRDHEDTRVVCYPGDEWHSVAQRALPGPTRLILRNKRFEPIEGGFEALFE